MLPDHRERMVGRGALVVVGHGRAGGDEDIANPIDDVRRDRSEPAGLDRLGAGRHPGAASLTLLPALGDADDLIRGLRHEVEAARLARDETNAAPQLVSRGDDATGVRGDIEHPVIGRE